MGRLRTNTQAPQLIQQYPNYIPINEIEPVQMPLFLEIGCGKGDFLITQAINNPNRFYWGVEKYSTVILKALKKITRQKLVLPNLMFSAGDAVNIDVKKFSGKVARLYLNFSDPWPKKRHAKRRLTSPSFLDLYKKLLVKGAIVEFKTDNDGLYAYSLETLIARKDLKVLYHTTDLYKHLKDKYNRGNVPTEYEKKFVAQGKNINKIVWQYK